MSRILIIEDEAPMRTALADLLTAEGYRVLTAADGESGLQRALDEKPDLILLDVMMPKLDGFALCAELRRLANTVPVLMLTAKGQIEDRVAGLDAGADDYLVKPFNPDELVARVNALLRRVHKQDLTPVMKIQFGNVTADFSRMEFLKNGEPVSLAAKEAELLRFLINHRGRVLTRELILKNVWSEQPFITERTVDVHVAWLRQKLEDAPESPRHILTIRGEGYRFNR